MAERTKRGPRPKHTTEHIIRTAIRLADDADLDSVSMAALAAPLGIAPTALYRYVSSKEALVELMVDGALGSPVPPSPTAQWDENAKLWARSLRSVYGQHPWLSDVVVASMPRTPHGLEWIEVLLDTLESSPLAERERLSAALLLQGLVRSYASLMRTFPEGTGANSPAPLLPAIAATMYPRTVALLLRPRESVDDEFTFALDAAIRGLIAIPHSVGTLIPGASA